MQSARLACARCAWYHICSSHRASWKLAIWPKWQIWPLRFVQFTISSLHAFLDINALFNTDYYGDIFPSKNTRLDGRGLFGGNDSKIPLDDSAKPAELRPNDLKTPFVSPKCHTLNDWQKSLKTNSSGFWISFFGGGLFCGNAFKTPDTHRKLTAIIWALQIQTVIFQKLLGFSCIKLLKW